MVPLLVALLGGGGFVGILTALMGRRNHQDDKQMEMVQIAYERNVYLEERNAEQDETIARLRMELGKAKNDLMSVDYQRQQLVEQNKKLKEQLTGTYR